MEHQSLDRDRHRRDTVQRLRRRGLSILGHVIHSLLPGDYTLTVDTSGDITGSYAFALWDLDQATPMMPGTAVSGSLIPATESDLYTFDAAAGDRFFFNVLAHSGAPRLVALARPPNP